MTLEVILDTNILIFLSQGKFNIHAEVERIIQQKHEIVILDASLHEMELLANKQPKMKRHLKFIKTILPKFKVVEYNPKNIRHVDQKIISYAIEQKKTRIVATNDKEMKNILRKEDIPVIFVKTFSHLELIGFVL